MIATIGKMTKKEFISLIENAVERKLIELIGDPDEGLELRSNLQARLLRQKVQVQSGERGESLANVIKKLGLK
jgi:5S rRNA maturation endonuclease (ribonuclease M5)